MSLSSEESILATEIGQALTPSGDLSMYHVVRRNGSVTEFNPSKITVAITKAYIAVIGHQQVGTQKVRHQIQSLTDGVINALKSRRPTGGSINIEDIQDQVELALMRNGQYEVARSYVLYREERARKRAVDTISTNINIKVSYANGTVEPMSIDKLYARVKHACGTNDPKIIIDHALTNVYDGITEQEINRSLILAARQLIEYDPEYNFIAAKLLLYDIVCEVFDRDVSFNDVDALQKKYFAEYIQLGISAKLLNPELNNFNLSKLSNALILERDHQFKYLGLQTLYDRYLLHINGRRIESPQIFFMRISMGLALNEANRDDRAIEFYYLLSSFDFMSSTPTLFNSGTLHSQLSSCYLTTVPDDLNGIYESIKENALLSKFAGGLGNDWTPIRGMGSTIKGTNGKSQGVIPFLKVVNDTAVAVNQCFAGDTNVITADGIKPIHELTTNDLVINQSGIYRGVSHVMQYKQHDNMVSISTDYMIDPIVVTTGHPLWVMRDLATYDATWIEAGLLQTGDYLARVVPSEIIPVIDLTDDDVYFYGAMLIHGYVIESGEFGIFGYNDSSTHLDFIRDYLTRRKIEFVETDVHKDYVHIKSTQLSQLVHFTYSDFYDKHNKKHIVRRFRHLPHIQTLTMIRAILSINPNIVYDEMIQFNDNSYKLIEELRYQLLRLSIPTSAKYHHAEHIMPHYELNVPICGKLTNVITCERPYKPDWLEMHGALFVKVKVVQPITPVDTVYDLKIDGEANYMTNVMLAHNGGKRKGAVCVYLETWHIDIEEFLELRKNTGDDRRRCHDMNTANWIPDLFMERVHENLEWTLFSPVDVPDLHDSYGEEFKKLYLKYEQDALDGKITLFKQIPAVQLWRKMLTMLFETGHPWITFKDPCNIRSPQSHVGRVHSSNLCTEITLNTNSEEIAVCNLGSINLMRHMKQGALDLVKLKSTIQTAVRMLDNVIDVNFYPVSKAENSNLQHRPIGMGIMGFQDCLYMMHIPYDSEQAVEFADYVMEHIAYYAYATSSQLARERGCYSTFDGSLWQQGILPLDSFKNLQNARQDYKDESANFNTRLDWDSLRATIKEHGMRNSNCLAIAPTATIANIVGVSASIEPTYQNLFVKSNLSGEFTIVNECLINDLKALGIWDEVMLSDIKYFDGSLAKIDRIPDAIKQLYKTAFEIDASWLVKAAAERQKWIDQAQSLNIYISNPSGRKLDEVYKLAWRKGLKTTYYLRTLSATSVEKSTGSGGELNAVDNQGALKNYSNQFCSIDNPDCESCQ